MRGRKPITLSVGPPRYQMKQGISGTVTRNRGGAGVDHAVVYLFRVDHRAKELVESSRTYTDQQGRFEMLTPAGLEVQIFVDPKDAKNVPSELKERTEKEVTSKGNML